MAGRSKEEQSPSAAYTLDQNIDDLYMRHFQTAVAQWNPELKNIKLYDGKIWIGSVPLEYNASFWSALYTLYAINHFAGRYLNENSRVLEIGAGTGLDTCTFVAEFGLNGLISKRLFDPALETTRSAAASKSAISFPTNSNWI